MKLTAQQYAAITRYRYGLAKSRPTDVPKITKATLGYVLARWQRFDAWNAWRDKGNVASSPGRPANVWKVVPPWEGWEVFSPWILRREILKARPQNPPPPHIPPVPPTPPMPANAAMYQYGCCMGQNPLDALAAPAKYKVWFTADPGYDGYATRAAADQLRAAGHDVFVWFVPTEVSLSRAQEVARRLGTTVLIGQCETPDQFDASWNAGLRAVIGNLSGLRDNQLAKIRSGEMVVVLEHYVNLQPGLQLDFKNLPIPSICVAVYDGSGEQPGAGWRPSLQWYIDNGRFPPGSGVYGPGMRSEDWAALR